MVIGCKYYTLHLQYKLINILILSDAGLSDMKIAHAMKATQVARPYPKISHEGAKYVVDYDTQTRLELLHRKDEDDLYESFQDKRVREAEEFEKENTEEWEKALAEFAKKYEKGQSNMKKDDLIRQLTIKREKKLETLHTKRKVCNFFCFYSYIHHELSKICSLIITEASELKSSFRPQGWSRAEVRFRHLLAVAVSLFRHQKHSRRHLAGFALLDNLSALDSTLCLFGRKYFIKYLSDGKDISSLKINCQIEIGK